MELEEKESRDLSMWKITIPHVIMETKQVCCGYATIYTQRKLKFTAVLNCYGELFRDWFERKVRWYKTGNNKEMFNFVPFLKHLRKKSLQGYLLQDRFERGR